jgi:hypothetical protein
MKQNRKNAVQNDKWVPPAKHTFQIRGDTYEYRVGKYYKKVKVYSEIGDSFGPYQNHGFPDPLNSHMKALAESMK